MGICKRLRLWREKNFIPRVALAREAEIDANTLAAIENGRIPLRYDTALRILAKFLINPHWLATGDGMLSAASELPEATKVGVKSRALFSENMALLSKQSHDSVAARERQFEAEFLKRAKEKKSWIQPDSAGRVMAAGLFEMTLLDWLATLPDREMNEFLDQLTSEADRVRANFSCDSEEITEKRRRQIDHILCRALASRAESHREQHLHRSARLVLQEDLSNAKTLPVKPDKLSAWERLRRRLVVLTAGPGRKTELAGARGVSRSAVSQWLSGTTVPTAEAALRLLEWVQAEEAKQQSPGSASTPPEPKTQRKASNEKKPNSGRRKT